jgi:hypothetical protein
MVVMVVAALALTASPASGKARWFGFSDNATLTQDLTPAQDAHLLSRTGANSARIDVDWTWVERAPGTLDLSLYDPIYQAWIRRGIRPLLNLMGSPRWAWPPWSLCLGSQQCHYPPDRSKDGAWAHFVAAVAQRYPLAAAIEVWNEPNTRGFFAGGVDPARYTELLGSAWQAVKSVAPHMPVLGGALAPVMSEETSASSYGLRPFLRAMYQDGARGLMDGISIHPYPQDRPDGGVYEAIDAALETRDDAGDGVPLWLTEVGASTTGGYTERRQAAVLGDLVPRLLRRPEVAGVYLDTLADSHGSSSDPDTGYGVVRAGGSGLKPAFCAIVRAMRRRARCARTPVARAATADWNAEEQLQAASEAALEHRRRTGSYAGLSTAQLHAIDPSLSEHPPALDHSLGPAARPARVAVLPVAGAVDAARLCNASASGRSFCVTIVHDGPWGYTAVRGPIVSASAAADSGAGQTW